MSDPTFHGWVLAIITSVAVIACVYVGAMWLTRLNDHIHKQRQKRRARRPWHWRI